MNHMSGMTLTTRDSILALLAAAVIATGCSDSTGPDLTLREVGILQLGGDIMELAQTDDGTISWDSQPGDGILIAPQTIVAPDTVVVGEAFTVVVYSIGINGCWGPDGQDDTIVARIIEVTPYDIHSGADACTEALSFLPHESSFTLDQPGEWTIEARGRRVRGGESTPVVATRIVVAR